MKKEDFVAEMNEEPERRTVIMNGEEMELGDDGEYHVINKRQFGRLSKLHAMGACNLDDYPNCTRWERASQGYVSWRDWQ